jgi:SAM-dependent methyltransferase
MSVSTGVIFDSLAETYDARWTDAPVGRAQRQAVWRWVDPLFHAGESILDLGCGTGADAVHFSGRGLRVTGIDASRSMVAKACSHGVNAHHLPVENIGALKGIYDGALSNFGALNCVESLPPLSEELGRLIRMNGTLAICLMGPVCAWETVHYASRGQWQKASRRWRDNRQSSFRGTTVWYPSVRQVCSAFRKQFQLRFWTGIGLFVPPSYVPDLQESTIRFLQKIDAQTAHLPVLRMFSDHRLLVFDRL